MELQVFLRHRTVIALIMITLASGCVKDIDINIPESEQQIVVEGYIENGKPPYVLLTRTSPFFGSINYNEIENSFIHGADVVVRDEHGNQVTLSEVCLQDIAGIIGEEGLDSLAEAFGFKFNDTIEIPNICVYTDLSYYLDGTAALVGEELTTYYLEVRTDDRLLSAETRLRKAVSLDRLEARPHRDPTKDSLVAVYIHFTAADTVGNFVRMWTKRNSEPFYPPLSLSVFDDKLFAGQGPQALPIERGQSPIAEFDLETYSYFWRGDTVVLKWCTIDKAHYDFWNTLENDGGDTPFSAPLRVKSNIDGGRGIWGGYNCKYYTLIVPK